VGRPPFQSHRRRPVRGLPFHVARREADRPVERQHRLVHRGDGPHHPLTGNPGLPHAGILRPRELRLRRALHLRGERPRRRFVALRARPPLGILPLGVGRLAHQRRVVLRARARRNEQPQTASFGGQPGQPAGIRIRLHRADQHRQPDELHLRRTGKGLLRQRLRSAVVGTYVGNRDHLRRGTRRGSAQRPSQFHGRLLHPRHEGHAHHLAHPARRFRRQDPKGQLRQPAHQGLGDHLELAG